MRRKLAFPLDPVKTATAILTLHQSLARIATEQRNDHGILTVAKWADNRLVEEAGRIFIREQRWTHGAASESLKRTRSYNPAGKGCCRVNGPSAGWT